jgi:hypothetical protein
MEKSAKRLADFTLELIGLYSLVKIEVEVATSPRRDHSSNIFLGSVIRLIAYKCESPDLKLCKNDK